MSLQNARQALASNVSIPTLPAVVQRISRMLDDPKCGAKEIGEVVAGDAPLSAKVLKIANSSYYGLRERCLVTHQAAAVLGVRVLRNVVMQASVIKQYEHLKGSAFDIEELWRHSILTAQAASFLARSAQVRFGLTADELYMCGLLHDLGQVVLLDSLKDRYVEIAQFSKFQNLPMERAEEQALGFNHADVGQVIATKWGLHATLAAAIQHHHELVPDPAPSFVAGINSLVHHVSAGNLSAAANVFDAKKQRLLNITPDHVSATVEFVGNSMSTLEV